MELGINLYSKWPYQEVIAAFLEQDIRKTFVCAEHPQFEEAMTTLEQAGIKVENVHAPFKGQNTIWQAGEAGNEMLARLCAGIDSCVKYDVPVMVAHVSNGSPMPEISDVGLSRFDQLMEYAKRNGVTVAFESHRFLENVAYMLQRYPEAGFCLDNCHEYAFTPGVRYLPMWGDRLVATHISDNEFVFDTDQHLLPFDGVIDFDLIARELVTCGKTVTLMLEIKPDNHVRYETVSIKDYYAEAAKRLRKLGEMVECLRREENP